MLHYVILRDFVAVLAVFWEAAFSYNTSGTCRKRLAETSIPCPIQADTAYSGYGRGLGAELFKDKTVDIVCGPAQIPQITKLIKKSPEKRKKALSITEKIRQKPPCEQTQALEPFESAYGRDEMQVSAQG